MRSAALLLGGMVLVGLGVALIVGEVPGRWVFGPLLVVAGLAVKIGGFASMTPDDGSRAGDRRALTLGGASVERPRAGIPAGRAPLRTSRPGAVPRPAGRAVADPARSAESPPHRRAS